MKGCLQTCVAALAMLAVVGAGGAPVTVTGDGVPLRAAAEVNAESIGTVARGTVLQSTGRSDRDWVQVQAPPSAVVYVYSSLVVDGAVAVNTAQVRSGPGIGYRVLGLLERGTALDVRERIGEWLGVAPPSGSVSVWIERSQLTGRAAPAPVSQPRPQRPPDPPADPPAAPVAAAEDLRPDSVATSQPASAQPSVEGTSGTPRPAPVSQPVAPVPPPAPALPSEPDRVVWVRPPERPLAPVPVVRSLSPLIEDDVGVAVANPAAAAARLNLIKGAPQGVQVSVRGIVRPAGLSWFRPSGHRLVSPRSSVRVETLSYLYARPRALGDAVGRTVRLTGRRYWVQGVRYPVLIPESFIIE